MFLDAQGSPPAHRGGERHFGPCPRSSSSVTLHQASVGGISSGVPEPPGSTVLSSRAKIVTHGYSLLIPAEVAWKRAAAPGLLGHLPAAKNLLGNLLRTPLAPCVPCASLWDHQGSTVESRPITQCICRDYPVGCWMHQSFPLADHHRKRENWKGPV